MNHMLPQNDESYQDFMIRMEEVYNKLEDAKRLAADLDDHIKSIKRLGYKVFFKGHKVCLTLEK